MKIKVTDLYWTDCGEIVEIKLSLSKGAPTWHAAVRAVFFSFSFSFFLFDRGLSIFELQLSGTGQYSSTTKELVDCATSTGVPV